MVNSRKYKPRQLHNVILPGAGAAEDLNSFSNLFIEKDTLRYEEFAQMWREKNMVYMYAGRTQACELRESAENMMVCALDIFFAGNNTQTKACSIYMIYALYETQALYPKAQLRVTPDIYTALLEFINDMKGKQHFDLVYVFNRLRSQRAFLPCATELEQGVKQGQQTLRRVAAGYGSRSKLPISVAASIGSLSMRTFEQLQMLDEEYRKMKTLATNPGGDRPQANLDMVQSEAITELSRTMARFDQWRKTGRLKRMIRPKRQRRSSGFGVGPAGGGATTSESDGDLSDSELSAAETVEPSVAQRRTRIRDKAFNLTNDKMPKNKSTRYRHMVPESSQSDTLLSPSSKCSTTTKSTADTASKIELQKHELQTTNDLLAQLTAPSKSVKLKRKRLTRSVTLASIRAAKDADDMESQSQLNQE